MITRYNITWNGGSHIVEDGTSTSYQVMGLTQGTNYSFTVTAENNCNNMSEGATAMATTGGNKMSGYSNCTQLSTSVVLCNMKQA